ncbi:RNA polymerase sigma factor [Promicromonospora soli]|uniref:RNA polymerase sigma factor n=1 Tax=Promicromonospora soli TaxID=2035533 RepID=UPI001678A8D6|nr:sigma-70 family RNA polymerase sigma factor [Promicromonospora soli]
MTTTGDLRIDDWVVHRLNVVRSVAARVPGIEAEEATGRALEKMVRIVSTGGSIDDPAPYWRRAAVNEAISMTRAAGRTKPVEDDTFDGLTPPVAGGELDAERQADVSMLRTALSDLADDDREILLDRHVHDKAVAHIAAGLGVRPHAVTMRLRRAEERLAGAFAAAHAQRVDAPECRSTRAAMHDYLKGRLLPRRQRRLEVHMNGCGECTRAFIDVREVSWMLRDLGQHLIGGGIVTGAMGGAAGAADAGRARSFGKKETAVAAGVLAALAIGGGAAAYVANQPAAPPVQATDDAGATAGSDGEGGGGEGSTPTPEDPTTEEQPPSIPPPAGPPPRPETTPKEDAAPVDEPLVAAEPAPAPVPEAADAPEPPATSSGPSSAPGPHPGGGTDDPPPAGPAGPEPAEPPAEPTEPPAGPPPGTPDPPNVPEDPPGLGTALEDLLVELGLGNLPGIDLATTTLDEIWELFDGAASDAGGHAESGSGD